MNTKSLDRSLSWSGWAHDFVTIRIDEDVAWELSENDATDITKIPLFLSRSCIPNPVRLNHHRPLAPSRAVPEGTKGLHR